jgi:hypothetical protein
METLAKIEEKESNLPTLSELFSENIVVAGKTEQMNVLLNSPPPQGWIKEHPYISGHKYLPIDKVELMLRRIFKKYSIEILREGTSFNGVFVVVRVHYFNPALNAMQYQDGIGAIDLQTSKGKSPADLANINKGAISMAFPIAKSLAIKDACDLIGNVFGANLNRRDVMDFKPDTDLIEKYKNAIS